jgi:triosephosphate isomerase
MNAAPLVIGNWKMELSYKGEIELARSLMSSLREMSEQIDIVVCPSYPSLESISELLRGARVGIGAQHIHWEEKGAWTGAVSVLHVAELVSWALVGHSEQRQLTGETETEIQKQIELCLKHGLMPVVCIGETAEERQQDQTVAKLSAQVESVMQQISRTSLSRLVIAYEPIWAIGTGVTPDAVDVAGAMLLIRKLVAERFDQEAAQRLRVIYGGSVTERNCVSLLTEPGVDGVLVGGASVRPIEFVAIARAAAGRRV